MGKTWKRRDAVRRRGAGCGRKREGDGSPECVAEPGGGAEPTPEEAFACLERSFRHWFDSQVSSGLFLPSQREDMEQEVRIAVARKLASFDPTRPGFGEEPVALSTYVGGVFKNRAQQLVRAALRRRAAFRELHVVDKPVAVAKSIPGAVSDQDIALSDGCRSVRQVERRMDIQTLRQSLTRDERLVFDMRMDGRSEDEIMETFDCDKSHMRKVLLGGVQKKARALGIFSREDVRRGLEREYLEKISENFRELFPVCGK